MRWLIAAFVLIPNILFAQKWIGPDSSHPIDQRQAALVDLNANLSNDTASIKDWLINNLTNLKRPEVGLKLTDFKQSPKAKHYRFAQSLHLWKIEGATNGKSNKCQ